MKLIYVFLDILRKLLLGMGKIASMPVRKIPFKNNFIKSNN